MPLSCYAIALSAGLTTLTYIGIEHAQLNRHGRSLPSANKLRRKRMARPAHLNHGHHDQTLSLHTYGCPLIHSVHSGQWY
jgi:hypothetical protein